MSEVAIVLVTYIAGIFVGMNLRRKQRLPVAKAITAPTFTTAPDCESLIVLRPSGLERRIESLENQMRVMASKAAVRDVRDVRNAAGRPAIARVLTRYKADVSHHSSMLSRVLEDIDG